MFGSSKKNTLRSITNSFFNHQLIFQSPTHFSIANSFFNHQLIFQSPTHFSVTNSFFRLDTLWVKSYPGRIQYSYTRIYNGQLDIPVNLAKQRGHYEHPGHVDATYCTSSSSCSRTLVGSKLAQGAGERLDRRATCGRGF